MKLPDFSATPREEHAIPPWASEMQSGDFISSRPSYNSGTYLDLFEEYSYSCAETGDMTYYLYDPVQHGADPNRRYPILLWLHGMSNALAGKTCVSYCGGEQYASPAYQKAMGGGAFVLVPVANEKRLSDGTIIGAWGTPSKTKKTSAYTEPVIAILRHVCTKHMDQIGKKFVMGASAGGYFTWQLLQDAPELFDGAIPISSDYIPPDSDLDRLEQGHVQILVAHGRHDELVPFAQFILPRAKRLEQMKNVTCYFPEWVRNGDGGVVSINYGMEMGQHCLINQFQANLLYNDGSCCDVRFPNGVTGWIRSIVE